VWDLLKSRWNCSTWRTSCNVLTYKIYEKKSVLFFWNLSVTVYTYQRKIREETLAAGKTWGEIKPLSKTRMRWRLNDDTDDDDADDDDDDTCIFLLSVFIKIKFCRMERNALLCNFYGEKKYFGCHFSRRK
jgi:hypothetical protein